MSASDHLNPAQFMPMAEFKNLYSADYDEPMAKTMGNMERNYRDFRGQDLATAQAAAPNVSRDDMRHGGPRGYVNHLKADITKNGIQEPLTVRGGNVLKDGHHRGVAAMELGLSQVPVRHIN